MMNQIRFDTPFTNYPSQDAQVYTAIRQINASVLVCFLRKSFIHQ